MPCAYTAHWWGHKKPFVFLCEYQGIVPPAPFPQPQFPYMLALISETQLKTQGAFCRSPEISAVQVSSLSSVFLATGWGGQQGSEHSLQLANCGNYNTFLICLPLSLSYAADCPLLENISPEVVQTRRRQGSMFKSPCLGVQCKWVGVGINSSLKPRQALVP